MRAKLRALHASDVDDLENWSPGPDFGVSILAMIGPVEGEGEESFGLTVCSPSWFAKRLSDDEPLSGLHTIFMNEFNYRKLWNFIERAVHRSEGPTWKELAGKLAWLGYWEFADYKTPRNY